MRSIVFIDMIPTFLKRHHPRSPFSDSQRTMHMHPRCQDQATLSKSQTTLLRFVVDLLYSLL